MTYIEPLVQNFHWWEVEYRVARNVWEELKFAVCDFGGISQTFPFVIDWSSQLTHDIATLLSTCNFIKYLAHNMFTCV